MEALEAHNKQQQTQTYLLRLMTFDEIIETADFMSSIEVYQNVVPLWTDDHSNYIGLHFQGACKYKISYINHEETDLAPCYRNISSFLSTLELHPDYDWYDLKKDYPSDAESSHSELADDSDCIDALNHLINSNSLISDEIRCQYIFSIMALTPKRYIDSLMKYLDDDDMYVQERACEIIGFHKYAPAREKLIEVSINGMHNGKLAAKRALANLRNN
ncbi:HEAT repeat domain-containing protein [Paenibacillus taiwanensis]|uniref:HEAT repeat domain-containing protein n=1 Tax=Paenibacillus taiwanensis TaxID=401638 RepID=UPI001FDFACDB|nr:HEAT repeat domain-containing protein [Paenibacillus taiwanensis]